MTQRLYGQSNSDNDDFSHSNNNHNHNNRLLIVGFGRVGQEVAKLACQQQQRLGTSEDDTSSSSSLFWKQIVGTVRDGGVTAATTIEEDDDDNDDNECCSISCIPISQLKAELLRAGDDYHYYYSHVLIAMPPVEEVYQTVLDCITTTTTTTDDDVDHSPGVKWLGMVSTTGVYGNHYGNWVTEESELRCGNSTASQYVTWEQAFADDSCHHDCQVRIFRCAGIYDATRSALHTLWKQQPQQEQESKQVDNNNNKNDPLTTKEFPKTNRIHVTDIAQAIVHSMTTSTNKDDSSSSSSLLEIYNLADDLPERRSIVMEYASTLLTKRLGTDWRTKSVGSRKNADNSTSSTTTKTTTTTTTTTTRETKSVRRRRREQEPKLIDNQKLKRTLLSKLTFPTYKEGLDAILLDPKAPWNNLLL